MYDKYIIEYIEKKGAQLMHGILRAKMGANYLRNNLNIK